MATRPQLVELGRELAQDHAGEKRQELIAWLRECQGNLNQQSRGGLSREIAPRARALEEAFEAGIDLLERVQFDDEPPPPPVGF